MIDKHFIDSAVEIRKEWVRIIRSLDGYQGQVEKAQRVIAEQKQHIEDFSNRDISVHDPEFKKFVEKVFNDIETQAIIIESKIKPLNDDIERLKKEELKLYHRIKSRYPDLTDQKIVEYLDPHIRQVSI
jgi:predicted  nucleic acid-binding Zn-ribbon protein